jgi:hypothetical protein
MESLQSQRQQDRREKRQYRRKVTIGELLARELRRDGARPFLTWYDDATGDRVELSVATTANWAAKIANFVVDELDVRPGDEVTVDPALHWTTAVVLLGSWVAGAHVRFGAPPSVEFAPDAMGVGLSRLVGSQPDEVVVPVVVSAEPALTIGARTWTHTELGEAAVHGAHMHGMDASSRVLSVHPLDSVDGLDAGLLVPLAAAGSVVLVANADATLLPERVATERITHSV